MWPFKTTRDVIREQVRQIQKEEVETVSKEIKKLAEEIAEGIGRQQKKYTNGAA